LSVNYTSLISPLIKAVQTQKTTIDQQKEKIESLESELAEIKALLKKNGIK
jgi:flagellar biosynthesis chaperone FliJ